MDTLKVPEKKGRDFWGDPEWKAFHTKCAVYKAEKAAIMKTYVYALAELLACEDCGKHFLKNLEKFPIDNFLGNNHDLFFWSYLIHDAVNSQINEQNPRKPKKISPPYDKVKAYYFKALGEDCKVCNTL